MSNDKLQATFAGGFSPAVVHLHVLYDAVCHECGWEAFENPFGDLGSAERAADWHRCMP